MWGYICWCSRKLCCVVDSGDFCSWKCNFGGRHVWNVAICAPAWGLVSLQQLLWTDMSVCFGPRALLRIQANEISAKQPRLWAKRGLTKSTTVVGKSIEKSMDNLRPKSVLNAFPARWLKCSHMACLQYWKLAQRHFCPALCSCPCVLSLVEWCLLSRLAIACGMMTSEINNLQIERSLLVVWWLVRWIT